MGNSGKKISSQHVELFSHGSAQGATSGEFRKINLYPMVVRIYHFKNHLLKESTKFTRLIYTDKTVGAFIMICFRRIWDFDNKKLYSFTLHAKGTSCCH